MKKETNQKLWAISLLTCGVCGLILTVPHLFDTALPDGIVRIVGIISLAAVAVLMFTTVRKMGK